MSIFTCAYLQTHGNSYRAYGAYEAVDDELPSEIDDSDFVAMVECIPPVYYFRKDFDTEEEGIEWCRIFNETEGDDEL